MAFMCYGKLVHSEPVEELNLPRDLVEGRIFLKRVDDLAGWPINQRMLALVIDMLRESEFIVLNAHGRVNEQMADAILKLHKMRNEIYLAAPNLTEP